MPDETFDDAVPATGSEGLITEAYLVEHTTLTEEPTGLIAAASKIATDICGREIHSDTRTEYHTGLNRKWLQLEAFPASSVTSVTITDRNDDEYEIDVDDFWPLSIGGVLTDHGKQGLLEFYADNRLTGDSHYEYFPMSSQVKVVYVSGFDTVPESVQMAVVILCNWLYQFNHSDLTLTEERLGDYTWKRPPNQTIPLAAVQLLARKHDIKV